MSCDSTLSLIAIEDELVLINLFTEMACQSV